ncbi:MAG: glutamate--tRNA ligase [Planctomycetota bacterium]|nr:MAG: glutamate--tRNA ligase [Planctomycetota bacterium]
MNVRVRFAPSPTGRLHIGGARTALFNWAFARRNAGVFILRVEDTDMERNSEESLRSILSSMRWLGLDWDEGPEKGGLHGPYFQSQRMERYAAAAGELLEKGHLYRCFCSMERLDAVRAAQQAARLPPRYDGHCRTLAHAESDRRAAAGEPCVLRHRVPEGTDVHIPDAVRGDVHFRSEQVEDWVAVRSGGMPTYNFCCVVDDAAMHISHVIRGEEHLVNTPKQVLLFRALGLAEPVYAHVPLILGKDGKKLSKRTGDTALEDYRDKGYPPEALFNFLCLLGFSLDDKTEIFGPAAMAAHFDLKRITRSGAIFDLDKLHWLCGEYIRHTPLSELTERVLPWLQRAGLVNDRTDRAWLERVVAGERERIRRYGELPERVAYLFQDELTPDEAAGAVLADIEARNQLAAVADALANEAAFPPPDFEAWTKDYARERNIPLGRLLKPMRAALTGTLGGPPVAEILGLLGRERALARLKMSPRSRA